MDEFSKLCGDPNVTYKQLELGVEGVNLFDRRVCQFSSSSRTVLFRYWSTLYLRHGVRFLRQLFQSECTSPTLLLFTLDVISPGELNWARKAFHHSQQTMSVFAAKGLPPPVSNYKWVKLRVEAKKTLGLVIRGLWGSCPSSVDVLFHICQFLPLPFSPQELKLLIGGFVGKVHQTPGYRRVVLRRRGILI